MKMHHAIAVAVATHALFLANAEGQEPLKVDAKGPSLIPPMHQEPR